MASQAAQQVKMGFFIAGGFWLFGIVLLVILALAGKAIFE